MVCAVAVAALCLVLWKSSAEAAPAVAFGDGVQRREAVLASPNFERNVDLQVSKYDQNAVKLQLYNDTDETVEHRAYLLVKTFRHRDKRYVGYMSLCHFKICNMGKRRSTRFTQITPHRNNHGKK